MHAAVDRSSLSKALAAGPTTVRVRLASGPCWCVLESVGRAAKDPRAVVRVAGVAREVRVADIDAVAPLG
ncbi:MAG: hypothetical protein R3A52_19770 [Polyangiales bacterium]